MESNDKEDDNEIIKRCTILKIKEKVKNNPKYIHPCSKDNMKILGFENGYMFIKWMQQNGILKNPTDIKRKDRERTIKNSKCKDLKEYQDKCAQKLGLRDRLEKKNQWGYDAEGVIPMSKNKDCSAHFGVYIGEKLFERFLLTIFEHVLITSYNDRGFDFVCKNPRQKFIDKHRHFKLETDKEYKIQLKVRCLRYRNKNSWWDFTRIDYNNIPDFFILAGWDNRESLQPIHIWMFHKDDIIRGEPFWMRRSLTITDNYKTAKCCHINIYYILRYMNLSMN